MNTSLIDVAARAVDHLHATESDRLSIPDPSPSRANREIQISLVVDADDYHAVSGLLARRYQSRGYTFTLPEPLPLDNGLTLLARTGGVPTGTLSVGFDRDESLLCEEAFPEEIDSLRRQGLSLCEFTKLAVDESANSKRVLAALFNHAFVQAHRVHRTDWVLVEVNPRHVGAYVRMLGFKVLGPERHNSRVGAPGVLLGLDLSIANANLRGRSVRPQAGESVRSFYRHMRAEGHAA